jgi:hypothetical protein
MVPILFYFQIPNFWDVTWQMMAMVTAMTCPRPNAKEGEI